MAAPTLAALKYLFAHFTGYLQLGETLCWIDPSIPLEHYLKRQKQFYQEHDVAVTTPTLQSCAKTLHCRALELTILSTDDIIDITTGNISNLHSIDESGTLRLWSSPINSAHLAKLMQQHAREIKAIELHDCWNLLEPIHGIALPHLQKLTIHLKDFEKLHLNQLILGIFSSSWLPSAFEWFESETSEENLGILLRAMPRLERLSLFPTNNTPKPQKEIHLPALQKFSCSTRDSFCESIHSHERALTKLKIENFILRLELDSLAPDSITHLHLRGGKDSCEKDEVLLWLISIKAALNI